MREHFDARMGALLAPSVSIAFDSRSHRGTMVDDGYNMYKRCLGELMILLLTMNIFLISHKKKIIAKNLGVGHQYDKRLKKRLYCTETAGETAEF